MGPWRESPTCSTPRYVQIKLGVAQRGEADVDHRPDACVFRFHPFLAGNLGGCAGVAAGSDTGLLRLGTWLWVYYCLLLLQSQEQQLPPRCLHCLHHKLPHVCAGHTCRICRARLSCQRQSHRMCHQVGSYFTISLCRVHH